MPLDLEPLDVAPAVAKLDLEPVGSTKLDLEELPLNRAVRKTYLQGEMAAARRGGVAASALLGLAGAAEFAGETLSLGNPLTILPRFAWEVDQATKEPSERRAFPLDDTQPLVNLPEATPAQAADLLRAIGLPGSTDVTNAEHAAGTVNAVRDFAQFFTTPAGINTVLSGKFGPEMAKRALAMGFTAQMTADTPEAAAHAGEVSVMGTPADSTRAALGAVGMPLMAAGIIAGGMRPGVMAKLARPEDFRQTVDGPPVVINRETGTTDFPPIEQPVAEPPVIQTAPVLDLEPVPAEKYRRKTKAEEEADFQKRKVEEPPAQPVPTAEELIAAQQAEAKRLHEEHLASGERLRLEQQAALKVPIGQADPLPVEAKAPPVADESPVTPPAAPLFDAAVAGGALARLRAKAAAAKAPVAAPVPERVAVEVSPEEQASRKAYFDAEKAREAEDAARLEAINAGERVSPPKWRPPTAPPVEPVPLETQGDTYTLTQAVRERGGLQGPNLDAALRAMRDGRKAHEVVKEWAGEGGESDALAPVLERIAAARDEGNRSEYNRLRKAYEKTFAPGVPKHDLTLEGLREAREQGHAPEGGVPENLDELIGRTWDEAIAPVTPDREATAYAQAAADHEAFIGSLRATETHVLSGEEPLAEIRTNKRGDRFLVPTEAGERLDLEQQSAVMAAAGLETEHGMDASSALPGFGGAPQFDPTVLRDLTAVAGTIIESGKTDFPSFARAMTEALDGEFKSYYHAAYNQVREFSEAAHLKARMTPRTEIENYDSTGQIQQPQQPAAAPGGPELPGTVGGARGGRRPGLRVVDEGDLPTPRAIVRSGEYTGPRGAGLDETQRFAVNSVLTAFEQGKAAYLLGDGTGVGKTGTELAIAAQSWLRTKKPSLIVTQSTAIIENRFKADMVKLGIPTGGIRFATYTDLSLGKIPQGEFGVAIFDEAHNLKRMGSNRQLASEKVNAAHKVFATATPMDSPTHAAYFLAQLTGKTRDQIAARLGYKFEEKMHQGQMREFAVLEKDVSWGMVVDNIRALRNGAVRAGQFIRREYPFYGRAAMREAPAFTPEAKAEQADIVKYWDREIDAVHSAMMKRNLSGQKTLELSRWAEIQKLPAITEAVMEDLANGKHVVVFAEGYSPSYIKGAGKTVPGFLTELGKELDRRGIRYAKVFEDNATAKAKAAEAFQKGEAKVLLATPKSGGAGLDMDDQTGHAPRQAHSATLNFAADVFDQMLGRVSRRNTASPAEFHVWNNRESYSDGRRQSVADKKLRVLRNIQAGRDLDTSEFERTAAAEREHGMDDGFNFEPPEGVGEQRSRATREAQQRAQAQARAEMQAKAGQRLQGGTGDLGQGDMFGGGDLFSRTHEMGEGGARGQFNITAEDAKELQHKFGNLQDNEDLKADYRLTDAQADQLYKSIPTKGGAWEVPAWAQEAVKGELEDHVTVLRGIAVDAYNGGETGQSLRINKQAKRFEQWADSLDTPPETTHGFSSGTSVAEAAAADLARVRNLVAPQTAGEPARYAGNLLRELNAKMANEMARAENGLKFFRRELDRTPVSEKWKYDPTLPLPRNYEFINAYETGNTANLSAIDAKAATEFHRQNEDMVKRVQSLGTGALTTFYHNYFAHIWDNPVKAQAVIAKFLAKNPLEGPKSFLKQRTHQLFVEGLKAGLKPVHDNPVDLWLLKKREVERYILGQNFVKEMRDTGLMKFKYVFGKAPEGWQTVNDKAFSVWGPPSVTVKEAFDAGMRQATLDLLRDLGVPHQRLTRIGGQRWGYEKETSGIPGSERIVTKFGGPDFVIWHELGHVLDNRYSDLRPTMTATQGMETELTELAKLRYEHDPAPSANFKRYARTMPEKMALVLQAYIHAPERMASVAPTLKRAFEGFLGAHPELAKINDIRPSLTLGSGEAEMSLAGPIKLGDWIMPDAAAQVVNNFISPGLNAHLWYRTLKDISNLLNSIQLFGFFHAGFTTLEAPVSKLGLAIQAAARGEGAAAGRIMSGLAASPVTNLQAGIALRRAVLNGPRTPEEAQLVRALESGGGRVGQDAFYRTEFTRRTLRAFYQARESLKQMELAGALESGTVATLSAPLALLEQGMRPVLEWLVPRQKDGVFAMMASREWLRLPPGADAATRREVFGKVWDSVDNRMGQVVYDNLFMNNVVKDVMLLSFRAFGWQLGKYREGLGAIADTGVAVRALTKGQRPEFTHRMAYVMALPIIVGTLGGVLHYLMTGQKPQSAQDYFMPQTGESDRNGNPQRMNLPSYIKDVFSYSKHPVTAFGHSLNPLGSAMMDLLQNKDFYDVRIRNEDDPLLKQGSDVAKFAAKQFVPFSVSGAQKLREEDAPAWKQLAPFFGVTPAPARMSMTPAQELAAEITAAAMPKGSRTQEQFDRSKLLREIVKEIKSNPRGGVPEALRGGFESGDLNAATMSTIMEKLKYSPFEFQVHHMSAEAAMRVWRLASPEERAQLKPLIGSKLALSKSATVPQLQQWRRELGL